MNIKFKSRLEKCTEFFNNLCKENKFLVSDIIGRSRKREVCEKRVFVARAMYDFGWHSTDIASVMSRDHSTVLNMINDNIRKNKRDSYLVKSKDKVLRRHSHVDI